MKNLINYYYDIEVKEFKKRENSFIFFIDNYEYEFIECYENINLLLNICTILKSYGKKVDELIINIKNEYLTFYEGKPHILLKKNKYFNRKVILDDIIDFNCSIYIKDKPSWKLLWQQKIDYYELQIEENKLKFPVLNQSFSYYAGLSEIAISLLNYVDYENVKYCISHKRLDNLENLHNPLNIIVDNRTRDIAEYIKMKYFDETLNINEIINFIDSRVLNKDEIILLLSRLMYPSYYFDIYDEIYKNQEEKKELNKIIKKNADYEAFLKSIYHHIKKTYKIPQIEFLEF